MSGYFEYQITASEFLVAFLIMKSFSNMPFSVLQDLIFCFDGELEWLHSNNLWCYSMVFYGRVMSYQQSQYGWEIYLLLDSSVPEKNKTSPVSFIYDLKTKIQGLTRQLFWIQVSNKVWLSKSVLLNFCFLKDFGIFQHKIG